jgi:hypothetical protein
VKCREDPRPCRCKARRSSRDSSGQRSQEELRWSHYFGLQEDLEALLELPVDLVEPGPIRNPYFKQSVEASKVLLFEAA